MGKKTKILIIDDEIQALSLFKSAVKSCGFEVITSSDGQEGIQKAITESPDIIILDIIMPFLDGIEVCKRLKSDPLTKDIPVIFLTACSTESLGKRAFASGAVDYFVKPINLDVFLKTINQLVAAA